VTLDIREQTAAVIDNIGDVITEALGGGTDAVLSSITYTLGANIEKSKSPLGQATRASSLGSPRSINTSSPAVRWRICENKLPTWVCRSKA